MKQIQIFLFFLLSTGIFSSTFAADSLSVNAYKWADSVMATLPVEKRIAQLFMQAAYSNKGQEHISTVASQVLDMGIGGLIFMQGGPVREVRQTAYYQSLAKVPLMIAMDAEWGPAMRLDSVLAFPRQMTLGAIKDNSLIYEMGVEIARELKLLGVHVNFAPVADVNNNASNPVINSRSFGENTLDVSLKSYAYMRGMQDNGLITTAKHFPGHGDTDTDSHKGLPVLKQSKERLDSLELYPFRFLFENGLNGIMVGHLNIPALDTLKNIASTLSPQVVTKLLQNELNFKGLIFTDALNMQGVADYNMPGELELKAFIAGNDILLMSANPDKGIDAIANAIKDSIISQSDVDARCRKVLAYKYKYVIGNTKAYLNDDLLTQINTPRSAFIKKTLLEKSITLVQNNNQIIPLKGLGYTKPAVLSVGTDTLTVFQKRIKLYADIATFNIESLKFKNVDSLIHVLSAYNPLIIGVHNMNQTLWKNFGLSSDIIWFINSLSKHTKVIVDLFGNPYSLGGNICMDSIEALIISYEDSNESQDVSAQIIFGGIESIGRLPVSVNSHIASGTGIRTMKSRLKYGSPEDFGLNSNAFKMVDSIALAAIQNKAFPSCQILAAKDGVIVYNKSFGTQTYNHSSKVSHTDLYDIASITKIAATVPMIMKLYEEDKLDPDDRMSHYLPLLENSNKSRMTIREVLAHQAGLTPFIPYWLSTIESMETNQPLISNQFSEEYPYKLDKKRFLVKNYSLKSRIYQPDSSTMYNCKVADGMWIEKNYADSIIKTIVASDVKEKSEYKYSDLGFILFPYMIEHITKKSIKQIVYDSLFKGLGMNYTRYNPLNSFQRLQIIPTENDMLFRKQLLQGYVHDQAAAMLGGVAGHAGLFSNTNDLAKLMQMYINGGCYGDERYFNEKTLKMFTSQAFDGDKNRRALGFDKPEGDPKKEGPGFSGLSLLSFGHLGFSGCMAWSDPETGIVFIFLSNRIHPSQDNNRMMEMNVRGTIQKEIYRVLQ